MNCSKLWYAKQAKKSAKEASLARPEGVTGALKILWPIRSPDLSRDLSLQSPQPPPRAVCPVPVLPHTVPRTADIIKCCVFNEEPSSLPQSSSPRLFPPCRAMSLSPLFPLTYLSDPSRSSFKGLSSSLFLIDLQTEQRATPRRRRTGSSGKSSLRRRRGEEDTAGGRSWLWSPSSCPQWTGGRSPLHCR